MVKWGVVWCPGSEVWLASFSSPQQKLERSVWYPLFTHVWAVSLHSVYNSLRYMNLKILTCLVRYTIAMWSYTMWKCSLSVMAICHFCLSKVRRKFEWYYLLYLLVAMQTHPCHIDVLYCHQLFVLPCQFWLSNLTEGTWHSFVELEYNFCDSVLYGRATRTSIAVVS